MTKIIEHFISLTQIPHCSHHTDAMRDFLIAFADSRGYKTELDSADNILIHKGSPRLCLQAHYDMVCMGRAANPTADIDTYIEDGWLKARDSSLGADNGIAIAMMMELMEDDVDIEMLLTADEEVGLIGANRLELPLKSGYMLNLDFEDEAEVCIGCAGGADIVASLEVEYIDGEGECYEVSVQGLAGGHSGVDIDKDIPSAIKALATYLRDNSVTQICSIQAGERRNSIPANATAIVRSIAPLQSDSLVSVCSLSRKPKVLSSGETIAELLHRFEHGVRSLNHELNIPDSSINLAIVSTDKEATLNIETSARAMSMPDLASLTADTIEFFERYGCRVSIEDKYPAWKPETNEFTALVDAQMRAVFGASRMTAIHAGLECGVILERYPDIKFASIGPTIRYPHSTREMVELESVDKIFGVLKAIISATK